MALTDRLGGKVRGAVRRARRDGPLDIVFVLFNADGMGGTARSGIEQANALVGLGEGHRVRILSVTRSGAHDPLPAGRRASRSPTSSTYAVRDPPRSAAATPPSWASASR